MGGKNLFIGNRTLSGSLLRNQRDFLIGLHYETESKLCPPNKSFISWLIRAHSSGRLSLLLFSADSAKDRTVTNVRLVVFLQPLGRFTTDRQIRQMVRRPCCAPQLNRSLPCPPIAGPAHFRNKCKRVAGRCGRAGVLLLD
jgi:hypothetical protein